MTQVPRGPGRISDVDIRLLRVFAAVVRCGGMAAAELELNLGRSTISRHVKDLEVRIGATLCQRGRGGFRLTPEGRRIHDATERLLVELARFQSDVTSMHERLSGELTIALFDKTVTNPEAHLSDAIAGFHDVAPEVRLDVHVEPVNEIERRVIEGSYHVGVIPTHRGSKSLRYLPLFDEQMYLYLSRDHPLFERVESAAREEILECHLAGIGFHSPNMEVGNRLGWVRHATAYDQEAVATLILSGRYVGFLPEHYAAQFVARDDMRRLPHPDFQYRCGFAAIHRRSPAPSRMVATFLECLADAHGAPPRPAV